MVPRYIGKRHSQHSTIRFIRINSIPKNNAIGASINSIKICKNKFHVLYITLNLIIHIS